MPVSKTANGNITPLTIVKIDSNSATAGRVVTAGSGDQPYGIAQEGTRYPPYGALDDGYCAISGEGVKVFVQGDRDVPVTLGGAVNAGDRIKPNTNGDGTAIATTADGDYYIGIMKVGGASGEQGIVDQILIGQRGA